MELIKHLGLNSSKLISLDELSQITVISGDTPKPAATLFVLKQIENTPHVLLTQRSKSLPIHAGEVALPGGMYESQDKSLVETALREANEEVGIQSDQIHVIGGIGPLQTVTQFLVWTIISVAKDSNLLLSKNEEIETFFWIPLNFLQDPKNLIDGDGVWNGITYHHRYFEYQGFRIWGVTAKIIRNFLELL